MTALEGCRDLLSFTLGIGFRPFGTPSFLYYVLQVPELTRHTSTHFLRLQSSTCMVAGKKGRGLKKKATGH